ncbi:hypothetical protein ELI_4266 [Eubacterium callanderi]|uniref:Uncharacterized protein n=1 Tax=Eubacterium callanderi TaxID=53442 RepID=E3GPZ5_9FIRM|nr:hypothetical protein ELI_4266 [Eubacterium callanderi]
MKAVDLIVIMAFELFLLCNKKVKVEFSESKRRILGEMLEGRSGKISVPGNLSRGT